jgi:hypothetical protein
VTYGPILKPSHFATKLARDLEQDIKGAPEKIQNAICPLAEAVEQLLAEMPITAWTGAFAEQAAFVRQLLAEMELRP